MWCSVGADLVVVTLQLLVKTLVALLHLLLVPDQRGQAVQRTRVQVVGVAPHHAAQRLRLADHLRPRLRYTHTVCCALSFFFSTQQQGVVSLIAFTEALQPYTQTRRGENIDVISTKYNRINDNSNYNKNDNNSTHIYSGSKMLFYWFIPHFYLS